MRSDEPYAVVASIGEGTYGTVLKCKNNETGQIIALKKFKGASENSTLRRLALNEIRLLKRMNHANIIRYVHAFQSKTGTVYLAMEHADSSLLQMIQSCPKGLPKDWAKLIMWQLLEATAYLHGASVMHRDLKPHNILVNDCGSVKVCDFGFARTFDLSKPEIFSPYVSTRWYRAPEILVGDDYGPAVDIWAIGCLFAEMVTGLPLIPGRNDIDQLWQAMCTTGLTHRQAMLTTSSTRIRSMGVLTAADLKTIDQRFPHFRPDMRELLHACLHPDPEKRLTASQLQRLPYFFDIDVVRARVNKAGGLNHPSMGQPSSSELDTKLSMHVDQRAMPTVLAAGNMAGAAATGQPSYARTSPVSEADNFNTSFGQIAAVCTLFLSNNVSGQKAMCAPMNAGNRTVTGIRVPEVPDNDTSPVELPSSRASRSSSQQSSVELDQALCRGCPLPKGPKRRQSSLLVSSEEDDSQGLQADGYLRKSWNLMSKSIRKSLTIFGVRGAVEH